MTDFPGVPAALSKALTDKGYATLTPVQEAMLDPDLEGRDVLVSAQTGSGKTVAFGLAMAAGLLDGGERFGHAAVPLALIIAPTRELALQVQRELEWLYAPTGAVIASCVGGMDMRAERRVLDRGAHIVVGTPGRLKDHLSRNSLDISGLKVAVLDEADEMLDLGFREDLEFILQKAPAERRTMLFSATVPRGIALLAKEYQRDAVRIATEAEREQHVDIEYRAMTVDTADRDNAIINVLRFYEAKNALVFCNTRATVNHLHARFNNRGFAVVALSGELSQAERTNALQAMRDGRARVCVATDVAARGIDLPGLELVVHADLPTNRETRLHRSGRTGRAGNKGVSALIVPMSMRKKAERLLGSAGISAGWSGAPSADEVNRRDTERLLSNPIFSAPVTATEAEMVDLLISAFTPEAITAGFVRQYMAARSAPEDLRAVGAEGKSAPRLVFENSVWVTLAVGSEQRAEPRWLLPMLCRSGNLTKDDIGAIRVQENETYVQLAAASADRFWTALGPVQQLEDGIKVTLRSDPPAGSAPAAQARPARPARSYVKPAENKVSDDASSTEAQTASVDPRPREPRQLATKPRYDKPVSDRRKDGTLAAKPEADVMPPGGVVPYERKAREHRDLTGKPGGTGPMQGKFKPRFKAKGEGGGPDRTKASAGKTSANPWANPSAKPATRPDGKAGAKPAGAKRSFAKPGAGPGGKPYKPKPSS